MTTIKVDGQVVHVLSDMRLRAGDRVLVVEGMLVRRIEQEQPPAKKPQMVPHELLRSNPAGSDTVVRQILDLLVAHGPLYSIRICDRMQIPRGDTKSREAVSRIVHSMHLGGLIVPTPETAHQRKHEWMPAPRPSAD